MLKHSSFFVLAMLVFYGKSNVFAIRDSEGNSSSLRGRAVVDPQRKLQAKCGCSSCTDDVLKTYAGAYKCGDRIDWLMSARGYSENDACTSVAGEEFPVECAGCNPDACADEDEPEEPPYDEAYECGCTSCTEEVWNTLAGPYSCGSRITWLQEQDVATLESYGITNGPFDKAAACASVSTEFPEICTCNPAICNDDEPTPQTSASTSDDSPPPPEPSNGGTVLAMSYNTEYTGYGDGRVPNFGQKIVEVGPDVVGLQECQDPNALARSSPGYSVLGGTGPQNYILYDNDRVEVLDSGWMDVPRDCYAQRTVTWGKFRIRSTGSEFLFFNTHLPHNGCAAQSRDTHASIARSLVDKRNELGAGNTPTIVVGDCNPFASSGSSQGSFESNLDERGISLAYVGTGQYGGHGYLDKIFASDGDWTIVSAGDRGTGSSDHPAIAAELRLN